MKKEKALAFITKLAQLLKEDKIEEAVTELETATTEVEAEEEVIATPAVVEPTAEELEKSAKNEKILKEFGDMPEADIVNLKKRASIHIDDQSVKGLLDQFAELKDLMTKENVEKFLATAETVEKMDKTPVSKQEKEGGEEPKSLNKKLNPMAS